MELLDCKENFMKWFDDSLDYIKNLKKDFEVKITSLKNENKTLTEINDRLTLESSEKDKKLLLSEKTILEFEGKFSKLVEEKQEEENSNNRVSMLRAKDQEITNLQKEIDMWTRKYKILEDKYNTINENTIETEINDEVNNEKEEVANNVVEESVNNDVEEPVVNNDEEVVNNVVEESVVNNNDEEGEDVNNNEDEEEKEEVDENNDLTIFMYEGKKYCMSTEDIKTKGENFITFYEYSNYECGKKVSKLKFIHWPKQKVDVVVITDPLDKEKYIYKHDKDKVVGNKIGYYDIKPSTGKKTIMKLYE